MGINATRRGVKTCPLCSKKIGYRAKQCKYCSPDKQKRRSKKDPSKESRKDSDRVVDVEIGVVIDNETVVSTCNAAKVPSTEEVDTKKEADDSEPFVAQSYEQDSQPSINSVEGIEVEITQENSGELAAGKRSYHTSLQDLIHTLLVQNQNSSVYIAPESEVQVDKTGTEIPDFNQQEEQLEGGKEAEQEQASTDVPAGPLGSPENAYDANSVALFLGHLAQQNGKKIRTALDPVSNNAQPSTCASNTIRLKPKHVLVKDSMWGQAKYRRIRPKSVDEGSTVVEIPATVDSAMEGDVDDSVVEAKPTESQIRYNVGSSKNYLFRHPYLLDSTPSCNCWNICHGLKKTKMATDIVSKVANLMSCSCRELV